MSHDASASMEARITNALMAGGLYYCTAKQRASRSFVLDAVQKNGKDLAMTTDVALLADKEDLVHPAEIPVYQTGSQSSPQVRPQSLGHDEPAKAPKGVDIPTLLILGGGGRKMRGANNPFS